MIREISYFWNRTSGFINNFGLAKRNWSQQWVQWILLGPKKFKTSPPRKLPHPQNAIQSAWWIVIPSSPLALEASFSRVGRSYPWRLSKERQIPLSWRSFAETRCKVVRKSCDGFPSGRKIARWFSFKGFWNVKNPLAMCQLDSTSTSCHHETSQTISGSLKGSWFWSIFCSRIKRVSPSDHSNTKVVSTTNGVTTFAIQDCLKVGGRISNVISFSMLQKSCTNAP